jgi:A/G-specific adenine glycosylase
VLAYYTFYVPHPYPLSAAPARRRFQAALLRWFDCQQRELPWRADSHPYNVWVSEIMLQQTRVAAVLEYYARFLRRFPDVYSLARARPASVLAAWSGLGYYRRARMMHAAARQIVRERGGRFPQNSAQWQELPGIGRYTAAALASICDGERCAVVDGNVKRVLERLERTGRPDVWETANHLLSRRRPGDFNQAMMELGATVCTPRAPKCQSCPVQKWCDSQSTSTTRKPKAAVQRHRERAELSYLLLEKKGRVLLLCRGEQETIMPGMWELPAGYTCEGEHFVLRHAIMNTNYLVRVSRPQTGGGRDGHEIPAAKWFPTTRAAKLPLTGVARKILRRALGDRFL